MTAFEEEEEGRSWLRADLRRLRGRDQVRGFRGLASLGPFLGAPAGPRAGKIYWVHGVRVLASPDPFLGASPWCVSTIDYGGVEVIQHVLLWNRSWFTSATDHAGTWRWNSLCCVDPTGAVLGQG